MTALPFYMDVIEALDCLTEDEKYLVLHRNKGTMTTYVWLAYDLHVTKKRARAIYNYAMFKLMDLSGLDKDEIHERISRYQRDNNPKPRGAR